VPILSSCNKARKLNMIFKVFTKNLGIKWTKSFTLPQLETGWTDRDELKELNSANRGDYFIRWMLKIGSRRTELHVIQNLDLKN
jgi:hypothetical protein